jgi:SAM-dependent methyltransferase
VLPELFKVFPKAKYVFLIRNPLAVFASFLDHMVFGNWNRLGEPGIRKDLLEGYGLIREGIRYHGDDAIVVRYEELVSEPEETVSELLKKLDLSFEPSMLNYGNSVGVLPGKLVDPKSIQIHQGPVTDYKDAWKVRFNNRQEQHFAQAFIGHLGHGLVEDLGYEYSNIQMVITTPQRGFSPLVKWDVLMTNPGNRSTLQKLELKIAYIWQKEGLGVLIKRAGNSIFNLGMKPVRWLKRVLRRLFRPFVAMLTGQKEAKSSNTTNLVSSDYKHVSDQNDFTSGDEDGWKETSVADRQMEAYIPLIYAMYKGAPRQDFLAAANALRLTRLTNPTMLEIGCGNGYYSEILSYLTNLLPVYFGLDFSKAMLDSASARYPDRSFIQGDALGIPIADNSIDIIWSGTVLMHLPDYKKAIREVCRVARRFCIFHSTPVLRDGPTIFLKKKAYGTTVPEVLIAKNEFDKLVRQEGFVIRHILESLPYQVGSVVDSPVDTFTYVCEKL